MSPKHTVLNVMLQATGQEALEEKLGRLSRKPGVKASLVLDRATGSILKTSGEIAALRTSKARNEATAASFSNEVPAAEESESKGLEDFAALIWNYVNSSEHLTQELDSEVRLRHDGNQKGNTRAMLTPSHSLGRAEVATTTNEEAGDCHRAGREVSPDSHP